MNSSKKIGLLLAFCIVGCLCAPFLGARLIAPSSILQGATGDYAIFWNMRVPRMLGAFLAGGALASSGVLFQSLFNNPLASPYTLGISSGAALGASLMLCFGGFSSGFLGLAGAAGCGGLASMLLVLVIMGSARQFASTFLLLAGVIVNFFFSSLVLCIQYLSNPNDAIKIMRWMMGSLAGVSMDLLFPFSLIIWCAFIAALPLAPELDLLLAGEDMAASRGVDLAKTRLAIFFLASAMVGSVVACAGPVGFVGLIVPQICRLWLGSKHDILLPASFMLGASFLVFCDLLARTILYPAEMPIGIITSLLGAPYFLWLLFRKRQELYM